MGLDDALAGLPTGTRDELCIKALVQALDNIDALKLQYGMRRLASMVARPEKARALLSSGLLWFAVLS